jgi:hypothetical protein
MDDFDIENLSPEDRAYFDAMVQEEMMKLEMELRREVEDSDPHLAALVSPPAPARGPPPRVQNREYERQDRDYERQDREFERQGKRNKEIDIDIQVKGPPPRGFGNNDLSKEERRAKQMEYARQLNDQAELPQPSSQRFNQPRQTRHQEVGEELGLQIGYDHSKDVKRSKQQEYARLLEMDQQHSQATNRGSLSANSRSKSNPRIGGSGGGYDDRREELSSSRSDGPSRGIGIAPTPNRQVDERQLKIEKQRQYANELKLQQLQQQDSLYPPHPSSSMMNSSSYSHKLSPANKSPQSSKSPLLSGGGNFSERDLKHQKQQEYAQQLAADQRKKDSVENQNSSLRQRGGDRLTPRDDRDQEIPYSMSPYPTPGRGGAGASSLSSEKEMKLRKQQDYAKQLEMDRLSKERIQDKETPHRMLQPNQSSSSSSLYSPPSSSSRVSQMSQGNQFIIGGGGGVSDPRQQKRREQELYAQQIREAASQQEILSPRHSLNDHRRQQHHRRQEEGENGTGLVLPGANIATAVQKDTKKLAQEKYRQELESDLRTNQRSAQSLEEPNRIPLHRRNDPHQGGQSSGVGVGGLIGHHETDEEKRRKKRELQHKYSHDLAMQQSDRERRDEEDMHGEPPYDPQGLVHREQPRALRDVSPIVYQSKHAPSSSHQPPQQQHQQAYRSPPYEPDYGDDVEGHYSSSREREPSGSLQQLKLQAARHVPDYPSSQRHQGQGQYDDDYDHDYPSHAVAPPVSRHQYYQEPEPEPEPPYAPPQQSRRQQPSSSTECTGLVIGGMTVLTAQQKAERHRQQQQYAREVADAANAQPIHNSRESYQERHRYKGNGLPGEYQRETQGGGGGGGGGGYERSPQQDRRDGEYRVRGTSNGGGISSISFGSDGLEPNGQQRMQRKGKQEEYANQLRQQMNYNVSRPL